MNRERCLFKPDHTTLNGETPSSRSEPCLFGRERSLFEWDRCLLNQDGPVFDIEVCQFAADRCLLKQERSMFKLDGCASVGQTRCFRRNPGKTRRNRGPIGEA